MVRSSSRAAQYRYARRGPRPVRLFNALQRRDAGRVPRSWRHTRHETNFGFRLLQAIDEFQYFCPHFTGARRKILNANVNLTLLYSLPPALIQGFRWLA